MDTGILTEKIGPMPGWAWMAGGGAILAGVVLLRNAGGGTAAGNAPLVITGSPGLDSTDVAAAVAAQSAKDSSYLTEMLAAAGKSTKEQIDALTAGNAAAAAAATAEKTALQTLLDTIKKQLATLANGTVPVLNIPTPGQPSIPIAPTPSNGRITGKGAWLDGLLYWQTRDVISGSVWDAGKTWRDLGDWWEGSAWTGGGDYGRGKQIAAGTDSGYGFKLPYAYNAAADTWRGEWGGKATESGFARALRRTKDFLRLNPGANPEEVLKLNIRRVAGEAARDSQGGAIGWVITDGRAYDPFTDLARLRADEQLLAHGLHLGNP